MGEDFIRESNDFLFHLINLFVELIDLSDIFRSHGLLSVARLLHNQVLLLNMLELFALCFLLQLSHLSSCAQNVAFLLFHHLDLIEASFEFFVQRMNVDKVRV